MPVFDPFSNSDAVQASNMLAMDGSAVGLPGGGATFYVDTVTGSDSNNGRSPFSAKVTLAGAYNALVALGGVGIIRIVAPATNPVLNLNFSSGDITFDSTNGAPWYTEFVLKRTSGWSLESGSIYSQASGAAGNSPYIETLTDSDGFFVRLVSNASTPTTPANGEWGYSGGKWYVNLPSGEDPNAHTIKFPAITRGWAISGSARAVIRNAYFRYAEAEGLIDTSNSAIVRAENCTFQYGGSGIEAINSSIITCVNCVSIRNRNDGFNARNTAQIYMYDCDSSYNIDEGASNHDSSVMTIEGGRYHHNFSGGCTVVNTGIMHLSGITVDFNGAKAGGGIETNGINFDTGTSGSVTNSTAANNTGCGLYCNAATVTITNLTSGLAEGNTLADVLC